MLRIIFAGVILLGLCGCSNGPISDISPKCNNFKCDFEIAGSDLSGELSVNAEGDLSLVFSGPDIINGTGIRVKENSVIIEFQGISERYSRNDAPKDSPALHIYDALIEMPKCEPLFDGDETVIKGNSPSGNFTAVLDGKGFITRMSFLEIESDIILKNHSSFID